MLVKKCENAYGLNLVEFCHKTALLDPRVPPFHSKRPEQPSPWPPSR